MANFQAIGTTTPAHREEKGLHFNLKKRFVLVSSKKPPAPAYCITVNGKALKQISDFSYLRNMITSDGKSDREIKRYIGIVNMTLMRIKGVLTAYVFRQIVAYWSSVCSELCSMGQGHGYQRNTVPTAESCGFSIKCYIYRGQTISTKSAVAGLDAKKYYAYHNLRTDTFPRACCQEEHYEHL